MLHSSCYDRGGSILEKNIVQSYTKTIDGGGVDFCSYTGIGTNNNDVVNILGSLSKIDLYKQMANRYCWFYPLVNDETFCITMIENAYCENDLILPMAYGCSSILEPFNDEISMKHSFIKGNDEFKMAVDEATERIVKSITEHEKGENLRNEVKNYVINNYTWDVVADKWLKIMD